jgi:hypothetical protein
MLPLFIRLRETYVLLALAASDYQTVRFRGFLHRMVP